MFGNVGLQVPGLTSAVWKGEKNDNPKIENQRDRITTTHGLTLFKLWHIASKYLKYNKLIW